jgi:hypothetical protein
VLIDPPVPELPAEPDAPPDPVVPPAPAVPVVPPGPVVPAVPVPPPPDGPQPARSKGTNSAAIDATRTGWLSRGRSKGVMLVNARNSGYGSRARQEKP